MWKPSARPELLAGVLGLDPALVELEAMRWQLLGCVVSMLSVALTCGLLLATCGMSLALVLAGSLFAALCTLNLMRLVHACAGLGSRGIAPMVLLFALACTLSQAMVASALEDDLSLANAWSQHPVLAFLLTVISACAIGAPAFVRLALPEPTLSFERAQRALIDSRIASQRDTCAELCDSLLAYERDRLEALQSGS